MINYVQKVWGFERCLVNNEKYCAKHLHIQRRYECSTHYHALKDETFYIFAGVVDLYVCDVSKILKPQTAFLCVEDVLKYHKKLLKRKEEVLANLKKITLKKGEQYRLTPFIAHKFRAKTSGAVILEVSTTHFEQDSYRLTSSRALEQGEYDPGYF